MLDQLHEYVIKAGAIVVTLLFIIRVCVHEIRRMKLRRPEGRQKLAK